MTSMPEACIAGKAHSILSVGCNYLSLSEMYASGTNVIIAGPEYVRYSPVFYGLLTWY